MASSQKIPKQLRQTIEKELDRGEIVKWVEQPIAYFFSGASITAVLFGIPWTSFAVFWMWGALGFQLPNFQQGTQPEYLFALFGVPFVIIGFLMLSTPVWQWQTMRSTVYVITNKRAIMIQGSRTMVIRSFTPEQVKDVYRREKPDGSGDVILGMRRWKDSDGDTRSEEIGFVSLRNVRKVENMLRELAQIDSHNIP
ncbi:hypothetical protein IQ215_08210 [Cyanobacterium stanieri LEGE 03274]|uniref:DUF304 domain-containing protein n=1 Tax=Cyanobacterium stanieri LEGE 03274 TaxID=1828756 RepID=A0ABR9V467_9CHRO|nr:hypothetical protein [Cyanobacterium stanieri]MBE9222680.1 hypothetical protein [Cyanobacterium stanieri LEGE 03274]